MGYSNTGILGYSNTRILGHRDTVIQEYWDKKGYWDSKGHMVYKDTRNQGYWDTRTQGYIKDTGIHVNHFIILGVMLENIRS